VYSKVTGKDLPQAAEANEMTVGKKSDVESQ
jgi:hypothetical protein